MSTDATSSSTSPYDPSATLRNAISKLTNGFPQRIDQWEKQELVSMLRETFVVNAPVDERRSGLATGNAEALTEPKTARGSVKSFSG